MYFLRFEEIPELRDGKLNFATKGDGARLRIYLVRGYRLEHLGNLGPNLSFLFSMEETGSYRGLDYILSDFTRLSTSSR